MNNTKINRGFISIELMIALIIIAIATTGGISVLMSYLDGLNEQHAAQQQQQVAKAAEKYLKDNFSTVLASAGATAPAVITVPMLRNTRYLPAGFSDTNIFGQQYQVRARKPAANQLETLIVTTGGQAAPEMSIRRIAQLMGAQGGYISKTNTGIAQGAAWQVALSNFGSAPGAGHLATALFFQDGAIANEYLYRNAVPGHPELNRMNTALNMGGNNIAAAGAITASGNITTSADISARNVTATGTVKAGTADVAGETYTGGWFRTRGNSGWYNEKWDGGWYMSDSAWVRSWMNKSVYTGGELRGGKLTSEGRTTVGEYLQINGLAAENAGCSPNGLVGRDNSGPLFCTDGLWKRPSGVNIATPVVLAQYPADNRPRTHCQAVSRDALINGSGPGVLRLEVDGVIVGQARSTAGRNADVVEDASISAMVKAGHRFCLYSTVVLAGFGNSAGMRVTATYLN
ncbi:pilus assembly protein PilV [Pseudomonas aeruginosa]|uniref:Pilus structural protein PilV n=5 Tax=Pseudomonas aeruginosa TaxID=287 RepID=G8CP64_PSEAI|nr:shufflon system plasmid conjugative transfer pilus tip adhesin PilV [Pseudomonas aeruginosa]VTS13052.1 Tfp pilus assembly protein PilE [Streptococcus dysgalactiae subsp. equisimilis]AEQ93521.1 pilus structural protein PilV [Pseudomonas aeruginosa]AVZ36708.1 shufflon system plasmid conjugative transfer pilus tip adhesin PilV [Pseudomonas aeruginosa]EIU3950710.1 shufflon system plasmid conjugative transfer pilus tip adhesin PilV [Pseudomonas aeruginosa]EIU3966978.1 shufflon system plasmid con